MPIDILLMALLAFAGIGAVTLISVGLLTFGFLADWFRDRAAHVTADPGKLAVTIADDIRSGSVFYVQGIFDTDRKNFTEVRRIKADEADSDVRRAHAGHKVTIWK
jgi:hypothetical protein